MDQSSDPNRSRPTEHSAADSTAADSTADSTAECSPASEATQAKVDKLIRYVNEQIELLSFDQPDPALLQQMIQSLVDPRRAARISLVESLSEIGEPATPFLLEGLCGHPEPVVRRACCNALTNIGDETAVAGLVAALTSDEDISVKSAAAGALAKVGAPAFNAIRDVLASDEVSESSKGHAAWAMATMSSEVSQQRLYRVMNDPSPAVRVAVVGAIAQLAQKQIAQKQIAQKQIAAKPPQSKSPQPKPNEQANNTLSILTEALSDPAADVRIEAAAHLARLNCQKAYQPLVACLKDPDWEVRKAAVLALGKLGNKETGGETVEAIAHLKNDTETAVQRVAVLVTEQLQAASKAQNKA